MEDDNMGGSLRQEDKSRKYNAGAQFGTETGTIVKQIVYSHEKIAGLMLERKNLQGEIINEFVYDRWDEDYPEQDANAVAEYRRILSEIESKTAPNDKRKNQGKSLALRNFCTAYVDGYKSPLKLYFRPSRNFLESLNVNVVIDMLKKLCLIVLLFFLITLLLVELAPGKNEYFICSFLGMLGSFVMICFNFKETKVVDYENADQLSWRFGTKLICGTIFGFMMLIFLKAGIIRSEFADNCFVQFACAFVAGVETRWVPRIACAIASSTQDNEKEC